MTEPEPRSAGLPSSRSLSPYGQQQTGSNLADILERVLDKGIVIVGDIRINLLDIELLTIKLRLLVASVDKAKEIGIDWWEHDPALSSRANDRSSLEEQNRKLRAEVKELRRRAEESPAELPPRSSGTARRSRETEHEPKRARRRPRDTEDGDREP
ncbi:gas vesicle protein [Streptomyces sp. P17]|uniref:gas vesicle protein n=1 Tax=Streptomyces sp. P17 TaxID=3074716 RepID=UPI0028F3F1EA|nr:gas vesicle protein [Streptomyces sp. P17]MDT9701599.1 gas vesicle protein [Streptomyces sp. P17]